MYSRCSRYFKIPPADRESDSALAELLSGNTLVHQSSLPRWMLFVLVHYIASFLCSGFGVNLDLDTATGGPLANPKAGTQSGVPDRFTALLPPSSLGSGW